MKIEDMSISEAESFLSQLSCLKPVGSYLLEKRFIVVGAENYDIVVRIPSMNGLFCCKFIINRTYDDGGVAYGIDFEDFLESVPEHIQEEFIFHIDMFR